MSLMNRLWLAVATAMLTALLSGLGLNLLSAREYLSQQLFAQGADGASGLALSMSQHAQDPAMTRLLVSALFDSGHFERVVYRDTEGKVLVERINPVTAIGAPVWFVRVFPLEAIAGKAAVSDGWRLAGEVEVKATSRFAHESLWRGAVRLGVVMALLACALGLAVLLLLRWARRPLDRMVAQAEAIGSGRFLTTRNAEVPELRVVSRAMNKMVGRISNMFSEQAARIEELRDAANRDPLSRLPNRGLFLGRLRELLDSEAAPDHGMLLMLRINDLTGQNRRLGRAQADAFVSRLSEILRASSSGIDDALVARLNGADFAILLPDVDVRHAQSVVDSIMAECAKLQQSGVSDAIPVVFVSGCSYRHGMATSQLLANADAALMEGETTQTAVLRDDFAAPSVVSAILPDTWRRTLDRAIEERSFALATYPVVATDGTLLHREAMMRLIVQGAGEPPLLAGQFVPPATRLGRIAAVDLLAVELALTEIADRGDPLAVNLSGVSLSQRDFVSRLVLRLQAARPAAKKLWLEVGEKNLSEAHGVADLADLSSALAPFGCRLGIDQFGRHFSSIPRLYEVAVSYLKIDASFIADLDAHPGNQRFIRSLVQVAGSMGVPVYAERVTSEAEWKTLSDLGVAGVNGPAVTRRLGGE